MINISSFIICKNEEYRISDAINSLLPISQEILIIDSGSNDNTENIVDSYNDKFKDKVKFIYNKWPGYGQQKYFAENLCKNDWILNIDADEYLGDELINEIKNILNKDNKLKIDQENIIGYKIPIYEKPYLINNSFDFIRKKKYLRFYNKKYLSYRANIVHDSVILKERFSDNKNLKINCLRNDIIHRSVRSFSHQLHKINYYTDQLAINSYQINKKISKFNIISIIFISFFKHYFLRKYFLAGFNGFIHSYIYAFSRFIKYVKIREIYLNKGKIIK